MPIVLFLVFVLLFSLAASHTLTLREESKLSALNLPSIAEAKETPLEQSKVSSAPALNIHSLVARDTETSLNRKKGHVQLQAEAAPHLQIEEETNFMALNAIPHVMYPSVPSAENRASSQPDQSLPRTVSGVEEQLDASVSSTNIDFMAFSAVAIPPNIMLPEQHTAEEQQQKSFTKSKHATTSTLTALSKVTPEEEPFNSVAIPPNTLISKPSTTLSEFIQKEEPIPVNTLTSFHTVQTPVDLPKTVFSVPNVEVDRPASSLEALISKLPSATIEQQQSEPQHVGEQVAAANFMALSSIPKQVNRDENPFALTGNKPQQFTQERTDNWGGVNNFMALAQVPSSGAVDLSLSPSLYQGTPAVHSVASVSESTNSAFQGTPIVYESTSPQNVNLMAFDTKSTEVPELSAKSSVMSKTDKRAAVLENAKLLLSMQASPTGDLTNTSPANSPAQQHEAFESASNTMEVPSKPEPSTMVVPAKPEPPSTGGGFTVTLFNGQEVDEENQLDQVYEEALESASNPTKTQKHTATLEQAKLLLDLQTSPKAPDEYAELSAPQNSAMTQEDKRAAVLEKAKLLLSMQASPNENADDHRDITSSGSLQFTQFDARPSTQPTEIKQTEVASVLTKEPILSTTSLADLQAAPVSPNIAPSFSQPSPIVPNTSPAFAQQTAGLPNASPAFTQPAPIFLNTAPAYNTAPVYTFQQPVVPGPAINQMPPTAIFPNPMSLLRQYTPQSPNMVSSLPQLSPALLNAILKGQELVPLLVPTKESIPVLKAEELRPDTFSQLAVRPTPAAPMKVATPHTEEILAKPLDSAKMEQLQQLEMLKNLLLLSVARDSMPQGTAGQQEREKLMQAKQFISLKANPPQEDELQRIAEAKELVSLKAMPPQPNHSSNAEETGTKSEAETAWEDIKNFMELHVEELIPDTKDSTSDSQKSTVQAAWKNVKDFMELRGNAGHPKESDLSIKVETDPKKSAVETAWVNVREFVSHHFKDGQAEAVKQESNIASQVGTMASLSQAEEPVAENDRDAKEMADAVGEQNSNAANEQEKTKELTDNKSSDHGVEVKSQAEDKSKSSAGEEDKIKDPTDNQASNHGVEVTSDVEDKSKRSTGKEEEAEEEENEGISGDRQEILDMLTTLEQLVSTQQHHEKVITPQEGAVSQLKDGAALSSVQNSMVSLKSLVQDSDQGIQDLESEMSEISDSLKKTTSMVAELRAEKSSLRKELDGLQAILTDESESQTQDADDTATEQENKAVELEANLSSIGESIEPPQSTASEEEKTLEPESSTPEAIVEVGTDSFSSLMLEEGLGQSTLQGNNSERAEKEVLQADPDPSPSKQDLIEGAEVTTQKSEQYQEAPPPSETETATGTDKNESLPSDDAQPQIQKGDNEEKMEETTSPTDAPLKVQEIINTLPDLEEDQAEKENKNTQSDLSEKDQLAKETNKTQSELLEEDQAAKKPSSDLSQEDQLEKEIEKTQPDLSQEDLLAKAIKLDLELEQEQAITQSSLRKTLKAKLESWTLENLSKFLKAQGLPSTGQREDLVDRVLGNIPEEKLSDLMNVPEIANSVLELNVVAKRSPSKVLEKVHALSSIQKNADASPADGIEPVQRNFPDISPTVRSSEPVQTGLGKAKPSVMSRVKNWLSSKLGISKSQTAMEMAAISSGTENQGKRTEPLHLRQGFANTDSRKVASNDLLASHSVFLSLLGIVFSLLIFVSVFSKYFKEQLEETGSDPESLISYSCTMYGSM